MKKTVLVLAVVAAVVGLLGFAGVTYAQTVQPPQPQNGVGGYGPGGMMGGRGGMMGGGLMARDGSGLLHNDLIAAVAEKIGLSVDEINTRLAAGETLYAIAQSKGLTQEQFSDLYFAAKTAAIDKAVAAGTITQAQADLMKQRLEARKAAGFGPGLGNCDGTGAGTGLQRGGRGRWNQGAAPAAAGANS